MALKSQYKSHHCSFSHLNLVIISQSDIYCLKSIKDSLSDRYNYLNSSWDFNNITEGVMCKFTGFECWHPDANEVLNIRLSDMGLMGQFPRGVKNCSRLTGLDLSFNDFSGPLPFDIYSCIGVVHNKRRPLRKQIFWRNAKEHYQLQLSKCP